MDGLMYQKMIYNKLLALDDKMAMLYPYTEITPELKGGTRVRQHPLPGVNMETYAPSTLAVGGQIKDARYREPPLRKNTIITQLTGGSNETRIDIVKRIMKEQGINLGQASKYVKEHNLYKKYGGGDMEGGINRLKKARRWTGFVKDTLNEGMTLADRGATLAKKHGGGDMEGGINRLKKARRWSGFAKDTINTGMDLFDRGATLSKKHGGVLKKLEKEFNKKKHDILVRDRANVEQKFKEKIIPMTLGVKDFYLDLGKKAISKDFYDDLGQKVRTKQDNFGRKIENQLTKQIQKKTRGGSNWIQFVKAFSEKHNIPYNKALSLAGVEYRKLKE